MERGFTQGVRYSNTFIAKKVHLKRVVSIVPCHTSVHQAKSAVKKSRQKLQNSAYGCRCQLGNMAVDRCVRSVTYHWITLRSPMLEGVMQSQLVSFHRPFEAGSLKLYLTPTHLSWRSHLFVPNLKISDEHLDPVVVYLGTCSAHSFFSLYDFCCGLFDFSPCALGT